MTMFVRAPAALPPLPESSDLLGVSCRVVGGAAPSLAVALEPGQRVEINPAALMWKDETTALRIDAEGGVWARGPGRLGLALAHPGQIFPLPLRRGEVMEVRAGHFLLASGVERRGGQLRGLADRIAGGAGVAFDSFYAGDQGGVVWVASLGGVVERALAPGEVLEMRPDAFLAKDDSVGIAAAIIGEGGDSDAFAWPCLRLTGAGRVALQTGAVMVAENMAPPVERDTAKSRVFGIELPGWGRR